MNKKYITGIYPGTFDPITFGHLDIIIRASHIVNKLIISVAENIHKKPYFKINERIEKEELERLTDIYHQILLNLNEETNN